MFWIIWHHKLYILQFKSWKGCWKIQGYKDALVRKLIERIKVYDDYFNGEFKSGIEIDVRL